MRLSDLRPGDAGRILSVTAESDLRLRLLEMGLVPGTRVAVRKEAPMGDPMELWLRGYALTLRRDDAACVKVEIA